MDEVVDAVGKVMMGEAICGCLPAYRIHRHVLCYLQDIDS